MLNEVNAFVSTDRFDHLIRPSIPGRGRGAGSKHKVDIACGWQSVDKGRQAHVSIF